jgi:predicted nucleic-acid-binding Zn-ribbon protein
MNNPSKCPSCENTEFEVVNELPVNSNYELIFVRCAKCHVVVGTIDYYNVGALIKKLALKLKIDLDK